MSLSLFKKYLLLIIFIALIVFTVIYKYIKYVNYTVKIQDETTYVDLISTFNNYLKEKPSCINIVDFKNYLQKDYPFLYNEINMKNWRIDILKTKNDSIILYEYGFDEKDNKLSCIFELREISFWNYLLGIKGDIILNTYPVNGVKNDIEMEMENAIESVRGKS